MQLRTTKHNLGALIMRCQVPSLTAAHVDLINVALKEHPKVLILLGLSVVRGSIANPPRFWPAQADGP